MLCCHLAINALPLLCSQAFTEYYLGQLCERMQETPRVKFEGQDKKCVLAHATTHQCGLPILKSPRDFREHALGQVGERMQERQRKFTCASEIDCQIVNKCLTHAKFKLEKLSIVVSKAGFGLEAVSCDEGFFCPSTMFFNESAHQETHIGARGFFRFFLR